MSDRTSGDYTNPVWVRKLYRGGQMIEFYKAKMGSYWWEKSELILLDANEIQSIEQMTDRTPGGSTSNAYVRIVMKNGVEHKIYGGLADVKRKVHA